MRGLMTLLLLIPSICLAQSAGPPATAPLLTLDEALRLASQNNRQVQINSLNLFKAAQATAETATARLPLFKLAVLGGIPLSQINYSIPAGAWGSGANGPMPASEYNVSTPRQFTTLFNGAVAQPLSQLYKINLAVRSSRLGEDLARESLRQTKQQTAYQVRQAYYAIVQTQSQIDSAEQSLKHLVELDALTTRRLAEETVLKSDSLSVKAKISQQRYQLLNLRDAVDSQKESFNHLLGRDLSTPFSVELQPQPTFEELDLAAARAKATTQRPEIRIAKLQEQKAELDIRQKKAEYIPDLSVQLSYVTFANISFAPQNMVHAGVQFTWQPFDWGQKKHALEQLRTTSKQASLTRDDTMQQVLLDVGSQFRRLLEARSLLDSQAAAQETEREKLRVTLQRYGEKAVLLSDVLQQQAALEQANSQFSQALSNFWTAKADFNRALGEE